FATSVPAFLGYAGNGPIGLPVPVLQLSQYTACFGEAAPGSYLGWCVRGFFDNEGTACYVVRMDESLSPELALRAGLDAIASFGQIDLVCAADVMRYPDQAISLQRAVVDHCGSVRNRFAILDSLPAGDMHRAIAQWRALNGVDGALYYPWLIIHDRMG